MGKCNLLAPPVHSTGNFILFSQYAEDLTRASQSEDFYRVTPSKYILLKLNATLGTEYNGPARFAEFFQNYYENSCSIIRSQEPDWTPEWSLALLWKTMFNIVVPTSFGTRKPLMDTPVPSESPLGLYSASLLKIGDINITSTRQFDGINYSEIYVNVPQGEKPCKYVFHNYAQDLSRIYTYTPVISGQQTEPYIVGYPDSEYPARPSNPWPSNHLKVTASGRTVQYYDSYVSGGYNYEIFRTTDYELDMEEVEEIDNVNSYEFNAILILYDVHKKNLEDPSDITIYRNIPMGLYLTGTPSLGGMTNPVKIWVNNADIYEQGTSYGLRICTRYVSTQNQLHIIDSTIEDVSDMYDQYAAVMGKIGDSQVKMDEILNSLKDYQNNITSHLGNVKNFKVNVPYIRELGGIPYWFVNGRNLGVATSYNTLRWQNY